MRRLFLLACLSLAACTTLPEGPLSERNYQSAITVGGRLSVRYQQGGQPQSLQGKFRWQQQGERTNITLYSPLGQTLAAIEITQEEGIVKVVSPIEGSPADRAGLKTNDLITKIDDAFVKGLSMNEAVKRMRGEPNTKVAAI